MLESEIKEPWIEIPFTCLENHWLIHKVFDGWFVTTRQWCSGTGISDCFFKAWQANPTGIAIIMGQFFLLWSTFPITEHKIAKKSSKLSNMTSIEYSTQCHLMFQQKAFPYLNLLKAGVVDVLLCFMTRCLFENTLCTLRLANAWKLCIDRFLRGLWAVHTHQKYPCLRWKKPNEGGREGWW